MTSQFKFLFSPIDLGAVTIKNRIVSTAHATAYAQHGLPTERLTAYHTRRAKGGVGLIILGATTVHRTSPYDEYNLICNVDESIIHPYQLLSGSVHRYGAKIFAQLSHMGRSGTTDDAEYPLFGPSSIPDELRREPPAVMERELIEEIVEAYGMAADRVRAGGLDGVEVHGGHSSLVSQFMSPYANRRTDAYGGSREKRLRFVLDVLQAIRNKVGRKIAVGIRLSGDEYVQGGLTLGDVKKNAFDIASTGLVDYLNISAGTDSEKHSLVMHYAPMYVQPGNMVYLAAEIKRVVKLPIIAVGRINDPVQAEKILADGLADLTGMTRAAICDPDFPRKAREGQLDQIRHCVACNQGCFRRIWKAQPITCIQNPVTGKEYRLGPLTQAQTPKKIVVVGGGPAGLELARVAAERGHQVTLFEKRPDLGGQVLLAARAPGRIEFGEIVRYLAGQLRRLKVDVNLGVEADIDDLAAAQPHVVVIAAGARPLIPELKETNPSHVATAWDILSDRIPDGHRFLIVDGDNEKMVAIGAAEYLADRNKRVEIITEETHFGKDMHITNQTAIYKRLFEKQVVLTPHTGLKEINNGRVTLFNTYTLREQIREDFDAIVLAIGREANDALYSTLKQRMPFGNNMPQIHRIGDCLAPRNVLAAISEGTQLGRNI